MEEPDGFAGSEVDGRDVRPLVAITKDAAIGQIVEGRTSGVFATCARRMTCCRADSGSSRGTRHYLFSARLCQTEYMFELKEIF